MLPARCDIIPSQPDKPIFRIAQQPRYVILHFLFILSLFCHNSYAEDQWQAIRQSTGEDTTFTDIDFVNEACGWIVGGQGTILHTTNGGVNWFPQFPRTKDFLYSVSFVNTNQGWAVGSVNERFIIHTTNGGQLWTKQTTPSGVNPRKIYFIDNHNGWAVGWGILYTTDGGLNWIKQPSAPQADLYDVYFTNNFFGWTVGWQHAIYYTQGIGNAWLSQNVSTVDLYGVFFIDNQTGWAVGENGTILHTTDGGGNWISQTSGTNKYLFDVCFPTDQNGYIVGDGFILSTIDGGMNWSMELKPGIFLIKVIFVSEDTGFALDQYGTVLKYFSSSAGKYISLKFTNPNISNNTIFGFKPFDIQWYSSGDVGSDVRIDVYRGEDFIANVVKSTPNNDSYSWTPSPDFPPGSDYSFVITSTSDPSVSARSDNFIVVMKKLTYTADQISAASVPVLDGKLDDPVWANIRQDSLLTGGLPGEFGSIWSSFSDNLITWKAVWCKETNKLYVAADVRDDSLGAFDNEPSSSFYLPYQDESLEFFTDGDRIGEDYWELCGPAQQWRVTEQNQRDLFNYPDNMHNHQPYTGNAFMTAVQKDNQGNWTCEAVLTVYNYFPDSIRTLVQGDTIGWDVWYDDSDNRNFNGTYYVMDHQVGWNFQGKAWRNTYFMGNLALGAEISTPVQSEVPIPKTKRLYSNYPNPFNPSTTIRYALSRPGRAEISIFDVTGKRIRTLVNGGLTSGIHSVEWDGKDDLNVPVSSGVYVLVLRTENLIERRKMTLIR